MFRQVEATNMGEHSLGVDFGTRATKVVKLHQLGDRINIEAAGSFNNPESSVAGGIVADTKAFGKTLKSYLASNGVQGGVAVFDIPSNIAVLRWLTLPDLPPEELREAAKFKIRKHLAFSVDAAYIEVAQPVTDEDGEKHCLVVVVPREVVDSRAEAILQAGLIPVRAELEAQAILRVVERRLSRKSALWRDASLTIIDFGSANTHMYVVQNQQLQFIRGVKFGTAMFQNAVAKGLEIPFEMAEEMLQNPQTSLDMNGNLRMPYGTDWATINLSVELEKLIREIGRLMRYFRSLHPERSYAGILDQAILVGGLVGLSGFAQYLEKTLGLRVEFARPIAGMMTRFNQETFISVSHRQEAYTVVMGLALAGLSETKQTRQEDEIEREYRWHRTATK